MLIGYARASKADGSQLLDLRRDALLDASVAAERVYEVQGRSLEGPIGRAASPSRLW